MQTALGLFRSKRKILASKAFNWQALTYKLHFRPLRGLLLPPEQSYPSLQAGVASIAEWLAGRGPTARWGPIMADLTIIDPAGSPVWKAREEL